jgi:hypothetical protein
MSRQQNAEQNYNIKRASKFLKYVMKFKYLRITEKQASSLITKLRQQIARFDLRIKITQKTKNKLNSENSCYHEVQLLLFMSDLQKRKD